MGVGLFLLHVLSHMFLFRHFYLFYFFAQFSAKKKCSKNSFQHIFAISDALVDPIWHKLYYHNIKWQLAKIGRNLQKIKKLRCLSQISVPQTRSDHPEIDQSCFTECRIL